MNLGWLQNGGIRAICARLCGLDCKTETTVCAVKKLPDRHSFCRAAASYAAAFQSCKRIDKSASCAILFLISALINTGFKKETCLHEQIDIDLPPDEKP